jgi:hypothetical protein
MAKTVIITYLNGTQPYDVYLCDNPVTVCVYIDTITSAPYTFIVPDVLQSQDDFTCRVVDSNGCTNNTVLTI